MVKIFSFIMLALFCCAAPLKAAEAAPAEENSCASGALRTALLYLPNVFGDLLDIVTVEFSFGNTAAADAHVTRFCDFSLETSDAYFAGNMTGHRFVAGRREAARVAAFCWNYEDIYVSQTCGFPGYSLTDDSFNLVEYYADAYQDDDIDLWAIGAKLSMFVGLAVDLHLKEIPDFFCSLVAYDLSGDNWK